jgi:hypothetical protein
MLSLNHIEDIKKSDVVVPHNITSAKGRLEGEAGGQEAAAAATV